MQKAGHEAGLYFSWPFRFMRECPLSSTATIFERFRNVGSWFSARAREVGAVSALRYIFRLFDCAIQLAFPQEPVKFLDEWSKCRLLAQYLLG